MQRRRLLTRAALLSLPALAGCAGGGGADTTAPATTRPTTAAVTATRSRSDLRGIYVQSYTEGMYTVEPKRSKDYAIGLMYTVPHTFWTVDGRRLSVHEKEGSNVHMMALVWDPETKTVLPEMAVEAEVLKDGDSITHEVLYRMISERMGFHYGDNFPLAGDGAYTATVTVGGTDVRRTGAFEGKFADATTASFEFRFDDEARARIRTHDVEQAGKKGAITPMQMDAMPLGFAPAPNDLPGTVVTTAADGSPARSRGCDYVVCVLDDAPRFGDGPYVAVSARTRYNDLFVPMMALSLSVSRNGETVSETRLERTIDPALRYHYGSTVDSVRSGDRLTISVDTPPQVSRHEGYEEAFLRMPDVTVEL